MKTVKTSASLMFKLGVAVGALLLGQQALALGTDAGTNVSNQAVVTYDVGTVTQTPIESDPNGNSTPGAGLPTDFLVDRRVSFTLIEVDGLPTSPVGPGDTEVVTVFRLTNTSNAIMDFRLSVLDFVGDVHGNPDTTDLGTYQIRAGNGQGLGGTPTLADLDYVDELAEEGVVEIYVFANAPLTVLDGQYANIELTATAADDLLAVATPNVLDDDLVENAGPDDPGLIESVFGDTDNDGFEVAQDSYEIVSAALEITKAALVVNDPFGSGKALPGATIEYTITVDNTTGSSDALNVLISDIIDTDVTFVEDAYGAGLDVDIDGAFCNADLADADDDGCAFDGTTLLVGDNDDLTINVAAGASYVVTFQVLIPNL